MMRRPPSAKNHFISSIGQEQNNGDNDGDHEPSTSKLKGQLGDCRCLQQHKRRAKKKELRGEVLSALRNQLLNKEGANSH